MTEVVNRTADLDMPAVFEAAKNWGRWGPDDQIGTLNLVTPEKVAAAAGSVRTGEVVSCAHDLAVVPTVENRTPAQHMMLVAGDSPEATGIPGLETSTDFVGVAFHGLAVTHIDALCHMFVGGIMYNGFPASDVRSVGARHNSIASAFNGIVSRGVLLDVPRYRGVDWLEPGQTVEPEDLDGTLRSQRVSLEPGDILLVRTGRDARRAALGPWDPQAVGLAGIHPRCIPWLHTHDLAMLGGDGISDPLPNNQCEWPIPLHQVCLVAMGVHLIDNMALTALAQACQREERWAFQLVVGPLRIAGGTGSPINPVAIL